MSIGSGKGSFKDNDGTDLGISYSDPGDLITVLNGSKVSVSLWLSAVEVSQSPSVSSPPLLPFKTDIELQG